MNDNVSSALPVDKSPRPVTALKAPLNFIGRQDTKPVFHSAALTGGKMKMFFEPETHAIAISDMREIADTLSIDREGFELLDDTTAVEDLYDDDAIKEVYYPEIEALLTRRFGASQVVIFDVTRRSDDAVGHKTRTVYVARRPGSMSTTPPRADRSARRISSARTKLRV